jgi:hypothetical protein
MVFRQQGSYSPQHDPGAGAVFLVGIGAVVASIASLVELFSASMLAGVVALIYIAAAGALLLRLHLKFPQELTIPKLLLAASLACAVWGGAAVFYFQWFSFTIAEWIVTGLYVAGLAAGALAAFETLWRILAILLAAAMVTAILVLPIPRGGEDASDEANHWSVTVHVTDENGAPLKDALAHCGIVMSWERELELDLTAAQSTDAAGKAGPWSFTEDRRLKAVICNALKNGNDGNAGYPMKSGLLLAPHQGENELPISLTENPHPDTAYLAVELESDPGVSWYYLDFELWNGSPEGIPFQTKYEGDPQPIAQKSWNDLRGSGFAVPADQAAQDLYLRLKYEGPSSTDLAPPKVEFRTYQLGALDPGGRRGIRVAIPGEFDHQ